MNKFATLLVLSLALTIASADIHAVLVAGSRYFYNYRHQSDICHAYHLLINGGVNPNNIIVMAYDDVANDRRNPFPGSLYNHPGNDQVNYYEGCKIDYKGASVTPENYIAILTGNKAGVKGGNGRVLESTENDTVFLNFSDHGAPGLIAFPSQELYANDLNSAFKTMHQKKMFKQLTYYLEACESGSMFVNTPKNINVYAVSAANPHESSWASYCPPQDKVNGRSIGSCLGDLFSTNWMEDSEAHDRTSETLQQQYNNVKEATTRSDVLQYGDLSFTNESVATFQGGSKKSRNFLEKIEEIFTSYHKKITAESRTGLEPTPEVKTNFLLREFQAHPSAENYRELSQDLHHSKKLASATKKLAEQFNLSTEINAENTDFTCYEAMVEKLKAQCGGINEYGLSLLKPLYNYCANISFQNTSYQAVQFEC